MFVEYVTPLLDSLNPSLRKQAQAIIDRDGQEDQYTLNKVEIQDRMFNLFSFFDLLDR